MAKEHNITNVAIIEKGWIGGGNVGRNTTIIRSNYMHDDNGLFSEFGMDLWRRMSQDLNYNVMFSPRGIINLAHSDAQMNVYARRGNSMRLNGIDAVLISTGNDFRAVEAGVHAFASSKGKYKSLSNCSITDNIFKISLKIPLSIGTVGGITDVHPMVKLSLKLLNNPTSDELMNIICCVGLAQNFAAVKSINDGSFFFPLFGTGAKKGLSVSIKIFSVGIDLNVSCKSTEFLKVIIPLAEK